MRTRVTFGRSDLIAVATHFKRKFTEFEQLLAYEQQKAKKNSQEFLDMTEKLKLLKIEKKILQQRLEKIPELEQRIDQFDGRLLHGIVMLRKSMIQNIVCLEFNKDLSSLMTEFSI